MKLFEIADPNDLHQLGTYLTAAAHKVGFADVWVSPHFGQERVNGTQQNYPVARIIKALGDLFSKEKRQLKQCLVDAKVKHDNPKELQDYGIRVNNNKRGCGFAFAIRYNDEGAAQLRAVTFHGKKGFLGNGDNDKIIVIENAEWDNINNIDATINIDE